MSRPRLDLGLDASRATLNEAECVRVAKLLTRARQQLRMSIPDVAARLLLAPTQVSALEDVRAGAFYSAAFYATALKKYGALVGVESTEMDRILVRPAASDAPPAFKRGRRSLGLSLAGVPRPSTRVMLATAIAVTAVAVGLLVASVLQRSSLKDASTTVPVVPPPAASVVPLSPEPASAPVAAAAVDDPSGAVLVPISSVPEKFVGHVRAGQRTWVFVRFAGGTTLERTLAGGEELLLEDTPTYIAVGRADDASIEFGGQPIDTSEFRTNGQLRLSSSQLARLTATR